MKNIKFPKIDTKTFDDARLSIASMNQTHQRALESITNKALEEKRYKEESLNVLKGIEKNTGEISELVILLNTNTEKQTEILNIMTEILSIGTAINNEEAEGKYRQVMSKITQTFEDTETMEKLLGYSKMFYHSAVEYIKRRIENGS